MPRSLLSGRRRGGRFGHRLSEVERTILPCFALSGSHSLRSCPAAPSKERDHLFDWRGHPSFAKEGSLPLRPVIQAWCPSTTPPRCSPDNLKALQSPDGFWDDECRISIESRRQNGSFPTVVAATPEGVAATGALSGPPLDRYRRGNLHPPH